MTRIGLITLGCEKNTVDSERYLAQMIAHGAEPVSDLNEAELIVVNTCGFIDAAKKESLDAIVEAGRLKREGSCRAVVAVGCMVERHRDELNEVLPEVDVFLKASEMERLVPSLREIGLLGDVVDSHPGVRVFTGELPHVRYLKISEGCDHGCAFCAIPLMRGRHRSFAMSDVIREAQLLELQGAREVNLVAQDLAHYGRDIRDGNGLSQLLQQLLRETSIDWFRLLYLYSAGITPQLLETIASSDRIVSYLDMPMQHAADDMLRRMRRPERQESIRERVSLAKSVIPDVAIRTTCIVGFPGETEDEFETLFDFLAEMRFDGVACFPYSAQEGTRAAAMPDDVPDWLKRERVERITELQRSIVALQNEDRIGERQTTIVDSSDASGSLGRSWRQAHDIDGITLLDQQLPPGTIVAAEISGLDNDYDVLATVREVLKPAAPAIVAPMGGRSLPLMSSAGAYGR